ncbi:hypothetical protein SRABI13_04246 [Erwinia aphidicola]|uniref:LPD7 domain-containing protein n=1 Tax=Erwinia aphidicola TaxID=68334 RepID=UPI00069F1674|nr:LPD7 domain-containing protein [Erwinia aphidicola]CAH0296818.1 hypothetical protein SRABI13_04246 [Erwinia aphidicola]
MLIRCSGYNSGVKEYLEEGMKSGRELSRDELDERIILDGNLDLTDRVYRGIENKGQDRYLTFTLSFKEDEVSQETLSAITQEFKAFLMHAYNSDEYNFYAEAHLPKVKTMTDRKTGDLVDRKPHIHVVIPRVNLLSGNEMNPVGDYTKNEKYMEAFQEYINQKYGLASPRENMRATPTNYADMLSRYKGDDFRAKNKEFKLNLLERVFSGDIRTRKDFYDLVSQFGETKVRNAGKENEYIAVKLSGDQKFTNLKESIFSDEFITERRMSRPPLDTKIIDVRFSEWGNRAAEIKYIDKIASPKFRAIYYASDDQTRNTLLTGCTTKFYDELRGKYELRGQRSSDNQRSAAEVKSRRYAPSAYSLQNMPDGNVAGSRLRKGNKVLLQGDARVHLGDKQTHGDPGLRRTLRGRGGERRAASQSSSWQRDPPTRGTVGKHARRRTKLQLTPYPVIPRLKNRIPTLDDVRKRGGHLFPAGTITGAKSSPALTQPAMPVASVSSIPAWLHRRMNEPDSAQRNANWQMRSVDREFYEIRREVTSDKRFTYDEKTQLLSVMHFERLKRKDAILNNNEDVTMGSKDIRDMINKSRPESSGFTISGPEIEKVKPAKSRFKQVFDALRNPRNYSKIADESRKSVEKNLDPSNLYTKRTRKGHVHYLDKSSDKTLFVDTGKHISMRKNGLSKDSVAVALELAQGRFGSTLNIKGSKHFKEMVVNVVAEKGLDIHFTDKAMNAALELRRMELAKAKEQPRNSDKESAFTIEGAEQERGVKPEHQQSPSPAPATASRDNPSSDPLPTSAQAAAAVAASYSGRATEQEIKDILSNTHLRSLSMSTEQKEREHNALPEEADKVRAAIDQEIAERMRGDSPPAQAAEPESRLNILEGKILRHGAAPYLEKEGNSQSYYVTLQDKAGNEQTHWGVGLKDTLHGFKRGNEVSLSLKESQPVQVQKRDEHGKVNTISAIRNVWEATRLDGPQPKPKESAALTDKEVTHGFRTANFDPDEPGLA